MDATALQNQIATVTKKRGFLVALLDEGNLGSLELDAKQALVEMDDLIADFGRVFGGVNLVELERRQANPN
jgi:hypothetical protein